VLDSSRKARQLAQDGELVRNLVQGASTAADLRERNLPADEQHGCIQRIGRRHRCARVEDSWPGDDVADGGTTSRESRTERKVASTLLVTCMNDAQLLAAVVERVEQRVILNSRQREYRANALPQQLIDDGLAAGQSAGCLFSKGGYHTIGNHI